MPSPKSEAAKNLAKFLAQSKEKNRLYHGTDQDINVFESGIKGRSPHFRTHYGTFLSDNPEYASNFALDNYGKLKPGGNVMPVYAQIKNPADLRNPSEDVFNLMSDFDGENLNKKQLWELFTETYDGKKFVDNLKKLGHDSAIIPEFNPSKNQWSNSYITFEPTQIKSAIGNRGTFNPLDPDITKKEGGKINPFKLPRELLFEMAGIPSMAGGGKPAAAAEMYKLITQAIERYTKKFGRPPNPEDVQALKQHAKEISQKAEIKTDPATQARARHEMATDPNLINPEGPDPFLTQATTGRTVKGTYLKPKVQDINDPNVRQNIEIKQAAGELEDVLPESITPSADYMARMGSAVENQALASGKTPMIDKLKAAFYAKNKRYPTDEELEVMIAEFNPARHQYGEKGAMIVGERPPTATGMADWRQRARTEGIPEAYLEKPPADYPKYLQDALNLYRGVQPGTKPLSNARINPDRSYADGKAVQPMTPREMQAMMVAYGQRPRNFEDIAARAPKSKIKQGLKKAGKMGLQGLALWSVPSSAMATQEYLNEGDLPGAALSGIETVANAAALYPPLTVPATVVGLGAMGANMAREYLKPEYKSVMEDYK